ncbi:Aste57867_17504 [Aphanomyces stellatus]|uniref:Aste57867_17504 protein n=1 Tax=Aphanomyces stellatus TaxID=120398 RepID=A0A485L7V5_9STRA|nr:hypothetical protein As57867_017444 [Aphanomyces stellatus]VFT94257.1 Aste57867_17504 [Aphanomyces stellatus]
MAAAATPFERARLNSNDRVFGGTEVEIGRYPWMAGLRFTPSSSNNFCGGSLIAPDFVLTAAHCVTFRFAPPEAIYVTIGSHWLNGTDDNDADMRKVTATFVFPGFSSAVLGHDIAILQLEAPSTKTPVALVQNWVAADMATTLLGWGQTTDAGDSQSYPLLQADLTVLDSAECQDRIQNGGDPMYAQWAVTDTHLCAGGVAGIGACYGDSGGPLFVTVGDNDEATLALVGDVSFGELCGAGLPDVYGRISAAKEFIDQVASGHTWV